MFNDTRLQDSALDVARNIGDQCHIVSVKEQQVVLEIYVQRSKLAGFVPRCRSEYRRPVPYSFGERVKILLSASL
jgi:hypothetical protein